jgi:hypothetical protein
MIKFNLKIVAPDIAPLGGARLIKILTFSQNNLKKLTFYGAMHLRHVCGNL